MRVSVWLVHEREKEVNEREREKEVNEREREVMPLKTKLEKMSEAKRR